jgi:hypothetical protein
MALRSVIGAAVLALAIACTGLVPEYTRSALEFVSLGRAHADADVHL